MAEPEDADKTEEPTPRKLAESRRKGQVALSREVGHAVMLLAGTIAFATLLPALLGDLALVLLPLVEMPERFILDSRGLRLLASELAAAMAYGLALPAVLVLLAALASGLVQNGPLLAPELIRPKLQRIALRTGFKRLFSSRSLMEFAKSLVKLVLVVALAAVVVWPELPGLPRLAQMETASLLAVLHRVALRILVAVLLLVIVVAVVDLLYQRRLHRREQRMTRRELRDELKQTEGDPAVRSRLRQLRGDRARRRMMAAVPEAAAVVTNPTHYAVALAYDEDRMAAPRVVAKGVDHLARRIRAVAEANGVPVIHDPSLARGLHATVDLGAEIPPQFYRAVARIIGHVLSLKNVRHPHS